MKIGLIGYGAWGVHHAEAILSTPGLELGGVCAQSEATRAAAQSKTGAPVFSSYADLLAQPDIEAMDIVLPAHLHFEAASRALRAGKHVLLEKPMALTPDACGDLIEIAKQSQRLLYVGHELRHSTQWGRIRQMIESGEIGHAQFATIDLWRRPYRLGSGNWRYDSKRVGSWILEEPIHFFDLGCWWMRQAGRPETVYARGTRLPSTPAGLWDNFSAIISFGNGAHVTVTQSLAVCEHHLAAKAVGDRGAVLAYWDGEMDRVENPECSLLLSREGRLEELAVEPSGELHELRVQMAHFAAYCAGQVKPAITVGEAALAVAVCWAAERSIETGLPCPVPKVVI